jgi:hypothetical protein
MSASKPVTLPIVARCAGESSSCLLEKSCPAAVMRLLDSSRKYGVTGICAPRPGGRSWADDSERPRILACRGLGLRNALGTADQYFARSHMASALRLAPGFWREQRDRWQRQRDGYAWLRAPRASGIAPLRWPRFGATCRRRRPHAGLPRVLGRAARTRFARPARPESLRMPAARRLAARGRRRHAPRAGALPRPGYARRDSPDPVAWLVSPAAARHARALRSPRARTRSACRRRRWEPRACGTGRMPVCRTRPDGRAGLA